MTSLGTAFLQVKGDFGPLRAGLRSAETSYSRQVDGLGKRLSTRLGQAAKIGSIALAGGLAVGAKKAFDEFEQAEKVSRQTRAVLKSTGRAANVTMKDIEALADAVSRKSAVDDEAIQSAENLLLTFTKVRNETGKGNDIFSQATSIIADMSAALGQDFKASTIQIGKALQDPIKGVTALRRVGVNFNEQQTEQIKRLVESGRQLEAQKFILRELRTEFEGSARAQATSSQRIKVAFDNLFESIGRSFAPAIEKALDGVSRFADQISNILDRKDLTGEEKFDRIGDAIAERLRAAIPVITEAAARIGPKIAEAMFKGFINAPPLIRLLTGAWLITRLRPLLAAFGLAGTQAGAAFGTGVAAGATGGAAGGAAAGGLAGLATRLKGLAGRAGFVGAGVFVADLFMQSMGARMEARSKDLSERLKGLSKTVEFDFLDKLSSLGGLAPFKLGTALKDIGVGDLFGADEARKAERLREILDQVKNSRRGITVEAAKEATQLARNLNLTRQQRAEIQRTLDIGRAKAAPGGALAGISAQLKEAGRITPGLINNISAQLEDLPRKTRPKFAQAVLDWATELRKQGKIKGSLRDLRNVISAEVDGVGRLSTRGPSRLRQRMAAGFEAMVEAVADPTSRMAQIVQSYLDAFGAAGIGKISGAIAKDKAVRAKGHRGGLARGGFLQGQGRKDTIPIMAAPGEAVLNRHQQAPVETALRKTYGFGLGELFKKERRPHHMARGGFTTPNATLGGRSKVTGDTDFLPAMLRALERLASAVGRSIYVQSGRRTLGEQQALYNQFAGKRPVARPSPNAPHVRGIAADITPGREVFGGQAGKYGLGFTVPSESWHIELLDAKAQGGARGSSGAGVEPPNLGRIKITGREGALRDLAQAAVDKVSTAAQRFVNRAAGSAPTKGGGSSSANRRLGRQMSRAIFGDDQWSALSELWQRESGWSHTAENPSSGAYGIPQSLPASKMASAGRDWKTNPATQIRWGLNYIKGRYGTPAAALAFHDAHNWYAKGGFVDGGAYFDGREYRASKDQKPTKPPKGLKAPPGGPSPGPGYKWDAAANKWVKRKKGKKPRISALPEINTESGFLRLLDPFEAQIHSLLPQAQERIQAMEDIFSQSDEEFYPDDRVIARLRREGHNIETIKDGSSSAFIDWTAVAQRKSELSQLLGAQFGLIGSPFGAGKGLMEVLRDKFDPLKEQINSIVAQFTKDINALKHQVQQNMSKHKKNEKRIETIDANIDKYQDKIQKEQDKKKPNRDKIASWRGNIRDWRDEKIALNEENENLRRANRRITGESQPTGDLDSIDKGELGRRLAIRDAGKESVKEVVSDKQGLVGLAGVGGEFAQAQNAIAANLKELDTLSTERIREAVAPVDPEKEKNADIKTFLAELGKLRATFGTNFKTIPGFAKGGITRQRLALVGEQGPEIVKVPIGTRVYSNTASQRMAEQMGIEGYAKGGIVAPPSSQETDLVQALKRIEAALKEPRVVNKSIDARHEFKEVPKEPHLWSKNIQFELEAAI